MYIQFAVTPRQLLWQECYAEKYKEVSAGNCRSREAVICLNYVQRYLERDLEKPTVAQLVRKSQLLWNQKNYYRVLMWPVKGPILSQVNPVHTPFL
jgi:hypothetical protein